jgi:hypothetical protein
VTGAVAAWAGWYLTSALLWLALVDNTSGPELVVGAGVSAIGASAALVVRQQRRVILRPRLRWLLRVWRLPAVFPRDMWLLVVALFRRQHGRFYALPSQQLGDVPRGAAQRVTMQTAASFAPNTYVIGTDYERDVVLVHQLVDRGNIEEDADPLRLR